MFSTFISLFSPPNLTQRLDGVCRCGCRDALSLYCDVQPTYACIQRQAQDEQPQIGCWRPSANVSLLKASPCWVESHQSSRRDWHCQPLHVMIEDGRPWCISETRTKPFNTTKRPRLAAAHRHFGGRTISRRRHDDYSHGEAQKISAFSA